MKSFIVAALLLSATAHAFVPDAAQKLVGNYAADSACSFSSAEIKIVRDNKMDFFVVRVANTETATFRSRSINLENMWTKVKTTRGMQRIVTQDRIREGGMLAEEKACLPGWVGCSEFKTAMSAVAIDDSTVEITMGEENCSFKKVQ
ncbi:MAG: hypothetical protein ACJ76H_02515 [Bacteriovoracaceae bacterium]